MKKDWKYKKLGEVAIVVHGKNQKEVLSDNGCYPIYGSGGNIMGYANDYLCEAGTTILGRKGSINNPQFIEERFWNVDTAFGISAKEGNDSKFLYYFIKSINWEEKNTGTTLPSLTQQVVKSVELSIPSLSEQHRIVKRLDAAFAHIDQLKANAEKQLTESRALFQKALEKAMEPKEGWEEKKLPDISENLDSKRVPVTKKDRSNGIYPYYGASGIVDYVNDYLFDEDLLCISEDGANLLMRTYPIAFPISGKVWVNNHAHVLRFKSMITQKYIEYYFNVLKLDEYITGAAQPKLTQKALNSIPIDIPKKIDEQRSIVARLDSLSAHVRELEVINKKLIAECDALKQALLRKVFE